AIDAVHCHQCGAGLAPAEQERCVDDASDAMSVPTRASSDAPLQERVHDRTPIALAERFERQLAPPRNSPPRRTYAHKRDFAAVPTEPATFPSETSFDEQRIAEEAEAGRG